MIEQYVKSAIDKYIKYMGITQSDFPNIKIWVHNFSEKELKKGYVSLASQDYDINNDRYSITVSNIVKLSTPYMGSLLFHEFTHILDTYRYVNKDKNRNAGIKGYTEFHAAQVELIKMLGNECVDSVKNFSMHEEIMTSFGKQSVKDYLDSRINSAVEICSRDDFPYDIATLSTAYGIVYNCWGIEAICRKYATDYHETISNISDCVKKAFDGGFDALDKYFMEVEQVDINLLIEFHRKMIVSAANKYKLF